MRTITVKFLSYLLPLRILLLAHVKSYFIVPMMLFLWTANSHAFASTPSDYCYAAIRYASRETGVPADLLLAVAKTETGRRSNEVTHPWPWAINVRGVGRWLDSQAELLESALEQIAQGETLFDLGCFQINYRWHGNAFVSIDEMISPNSNALYAANFLKSLHKEFGDWTEAVGAYHSRTEVHATNYKAKFFEHYAEIGREPVLDPPSKSSRKNTFPLLQSASAKPQLGSLVPSASK